MCAVTSAAAKAKIAQRSMRALRTVCPSDLGYSLSTVSNSIGKFHKRVNAQDTSAEIGPDLPLEIAHLLLIDVTGYSKRMVDDQIELLQQLNQIVRSTECFRTAERLGN